MKETAVALTSCPLCRSGLSRQGSSLVCAKGHCYNIARQGHVNFVPNQREGFYQKELFESRARVFEAGVYAPVVERVSAVAARYLPAEGGVLVDAGCGEGYYTKSVCPGRELTRIGFDLSKEAVRMAARGGRPETFFVADLAKIPLKDACADVVLDIFTPANYAEFGRILKPEGVVIKLAPRARYLRQLREAAGERLRRSEYDGGAVERYAQEKMDILETQTITYTLPVDETLSRHLARMTPMLAGIDIETLDLSDMTEITVDETLTVGRIRGK